MTPRPTPPTTTANTCQQASTEKPSGDQQKSLAEQTETMTEATVTIISSPVSIEKQEFQALVMIIYPQFQNLQTNELSGCRKPKNDPRIISLLENQQAPKSTLLEKDGIIVILPFASHGMRKHQQGSAPNFLRITPQHALNPLQMIRDHPDITSRYEYVQSFCHAKHITIPNLCKE
jgi:hypothetical protein